MKQFIILLILFFTNMTCLLAYSVECEVGQRQNKSVSIDLTNLDEVRAAMTGKWYRFVEKDTIVETFEFNENSFEGKCFSKDYISTAPIFTLLRENDKTIIRWRDLTGGEFDYIFLALAENSMTLQFNKQKIRYHKIS